MSDEHRPKPRRGRLLWLLTLPALAAALYLTRPRRNQLVPYITPPLNPQGDRISLLVPKDWTATRSYEGLVVIIRPRPQPAWLAWLRLRKPEPDAGIVVNLVPKGFAKDNDILPGEEQIGRGGQGSRRSVGSFWVVNSDNGEMPYIKYFRNNEASFDATHAAIFRSARIIPGRGKARLEGAQDL